jgi:hypothetical protein
MIRHDPEKLTADMAEFGCAIRQIDGPSPTMFQVIGERACGTNVVRKTIEKNTKLFRTEGLGWKHGFPTMVAIPNELIAICVFRNAVSWALSMHKRPWHLEPELQKLSFSDFLRCEWRTIVDRPTDFEQLHPEIKAEGQPLQFDRHPITGQRFQNLFELRRLKTAALMGIGNRGCSFAWVQLETLQSAPEAFMEYFRQALDVPAKRDFFRPVTRQLGSRFKASVRTRPETPSQMSADDLAFLKANLDLEAESQLGYRY